MELNLDIKQNFKAHWDTIQKTNRTGNSTYAETAEIHTQMVSKDFDYRYIKPDIRAPNGERVVKGSASKRYYTIDQYIMSNLKEPMVIKS